MAIQDTSRPLTENPLDYNSHPNKEHTHALQKFYGAAYLSAKGILSAGVLYFDTLLLPYLQRTW
jgi:hypothetical protein